MRIAIVCYSLTGHTADMASEIVKGIEEEGAEAKIFNIGKAPADLEYISSCNGLIIGTPTYLASSVWQIKKWLEEDSKSIALGGKLGGAFATAHFAQGGQDTAIIQHVKRQLFIDITEKREYNIKRKHTKESKPKSFENIFAQPEKRKQFFRLDYDYCQNQSSKSKK